MVLARMIVVVAILVVVSGPENLIRWVRGFRQTIGVLRPVHQTDADTEQEFAG